MSTETDTNLDLDLDKLFLPAWAQGAPANKFADHSGEDKSERRGRGPRRDGGAPRGDRPGGPRRDFGGAPRGDRPPGPRREGQGGPRGERFGSPRRDGGRGKFGDNRGPRYDQQREQRPAAPPAPLPDLNVAFMPEDKGVESLARQIKMNGRAYPLFQIARMILQKPERHTVTFGVKKNAEGAATQQLFVVALDDSPWLSEDEAVAHVLRKHFATFYQAERTPTDPPKGTYTFVAQCGMSGIILGPPNYHDYQNKLRKLHTERFARMPFEAFKARVKIVKDEAVVKKWIEDQSFKTEYVCLNVAEPLRLNSLEDVEKHFREVHKANIIKPVESHKVTGLASRSLRSPELTRLVRASWDSQFGFPLQIATELSRRFAEHGLQFFKVNKTVTHVSVARPNYLDLETTPVSDGIRKIVEFINTNPKCSRRKLIESLAPSPKPAPIPVQPAPAEGAPAGAPPEGAAPVKTSPAAAPEPTPEQNAIIADLHWLIHQGHVLEFADGRMETAKKPAPKPPKPEAKPTPAGEAPAAAQPAAAAAEETISAAEVVATASPEELANAETPTPNAPEAPAEANQSAEVASPS